MRPDEMVRKFLEFHEQYCLEPDRPIVADSPFRFAKDVLDESDLVAEWNRRSAHWRLSPLGTMLNIQAFIPFFNFNLSKSEVVLGLGSGIGIYETFLAWLFRKSKTSRVQYICVDSALEMSKRHLELARRVGLTNVHPVLASANRLPVNDATVDHVICLDAIQWMTDWRTVIAEVSRVMKPRGNRRFFVNVHAKLRGCHLGTSIVAINNASLFQLKHDLIDQGFRIDEIVEVDRGTGLSGGATGTLIVAKHRPVRS